MLYSHLYEHRVPPSSVADDHVAGLGAGAAKADPAREKQGWVVRIGDRGTRLPTSAEARSSPDEDIAWQGEGKLYALVRSFAHEAPVHFEGSDRIVVRVIEIGP